MGVLGNVCCVAAVVKNSVYSLGVLKYVVCLYSGCDGSTLSFELNDYQLISKSRYCSKAGGLIIYIHNDFNFKHVDISSEMSDNDETKPSWEILYIEIKHKSTNSKTHIIGNIYRRPIDIVSSCNNFSAAFAETLTLLQKNKRSIYI